MYVSTVKVFPEDTPKYMLKACLIAWGEYTMVETRWSDRKTCNYKVVGSNPTKLTADFTMTIIRLASSY